MDLNYRKHILQFDLSLIYWLVKYKLIKPTEYTDKLIIAIDKEDSTNNSSQFYSKNVFKNKAVQIEVFKGVLGKWMSILSPWRDSQLKLTEEEYTGVKINIKRPPNGLIGLKGDTSLVSPLIHRLDVDYRSNRQLYKGIAPLHSYLTDTEAENNITIDVDSTILDSFTLDAENIWQNVHNFLKNIKEIQGLNDYIERIDVLPSADEHLAADFEKVERLLPDLSPFPTICYLVGLESNKKISELEVQGLITKYQQLLQSDEKSMERFIQENFHCLISRFRLLHIDIVRYLYTALVNSSGFVKVISEILHIPQELETSSSSKTGVKTVMAVLNSMRRYGIGGISNWCRVKCLHSLYAYSTFFEVSNSVSLDFINSNI